MTLVSVTPHFLNSDFLSTERGRRIVSSMLTRNKTQRRAFALLERPVHAPVDAMDVFEYKLFISGRSGVGKTSMACKLSANPVPARHSETAGISTYTVFWPAQIKDSEQVVMFKLTLYDTGENTLKRFDHVLAACKDKVDGVIFSFSFADKASFDDLSHQMSRVTSADDNFCRFVIGTKLDLAATEVTGRDVSNFENAYNLPVLGISSTNETSAHASQGQSLPEETVQLTPLLNYICDELWRRDQALASRV